MNKCRAPTIPPLLINNQFILNCSKKVKYFTFLTDKKLDLLTIGNDEIISLVRNINPNQATGSDGISGQMLLQCDDSRYITS